MSSKVEIYLDGKLVTTLDNIVLWYTMQQYDDETHTMKIHYHTPMETQ